MRGCGAFATQTQPATTVFDANELPIYGDLLGLGEIRSTPELDAVLGCSQSGGSDAVIRQLLVAPFSVSRHADGAGHLPIDGSNESAPAFAEI